MPDIWIVYLIVALALAFDFVNGFHDAANSIATVVCTRVLSPRWAVIWAALFNFIAFLIFDTKVATTIGKGVVHPSAVTLAVITAGLIGAIVWNLVTWYYGIPSSSSHALVGGFAGAAVAKAGAESLMVAGLLKVGVFIFVAPLLGVALGFILMAALYLGISMYHNTYGRSSPRKIDNLFRKLQLLSAAAYSLGHGGNDAQKTMGIILAVLIAGGQLDSHAESPTWVVLTCHAAMGLGTMMGGWRIVKTMGAKITVLQPIHGCAAETAGAVCLYGATLFGIPVSTTHTITGAILGVGTTRGLRTVKWGVAGRVIWAWILTIPAAAAISAGCWWLFSALGWH